MNLVERQRELSREPAPAGISLDIGIGGISAAASRDTASITHTFTA